MNLNQYYYSDANSGDRGIWAQILELDLWSIFWKNIIIIIYIKIYIGQYIYVLSN